MSETGRETSEVERFTAQVSFDEAQLTELQATIVNEVAPVIRAKEIHDKASELVEADYHWVTLHSILSHNFVDFFRNDKSIKHDGKVLDTKELYMPIGMQFQSEHPAIKGRNLGEFQLGAINLDSGKAVIGSCIRRDNPSDIESETESWFAFIVDPSLAEQAIEVFFCSEDDYGETVHQALLPVLADEETAGQ